MGVGKEVGRAYRVEGDAAASRLGKGVVAGPGGSGGVCSHPTACFPIWEHVLLDSTGSFPVARLVPA